MKEAGLEFVTAEADFDESFPDGLSPDETAVYVAEKKADHFDELIKDQQNILITADTLVFIDGHILGKPGSKDEATEMLRKLSGSMHRVVTGICLRSRDKSVSFTDWTDVYFKELTDTEIDFYIEHYKPYDKAGAYGAQEWIGYIGITRITGSYFNVMGLPVHRLYEELARF
jgi:septum formation protein